VSGCESGFAWVTWLLIYNIVRIGLDFDRDAERLADLSKLNLLMVVQF